MSGTAATAGLSLSASDLSSLVSTTSTLQRLLAFDAAWTGIAESSGGSLSGVDEGTLTAIVGTMLQDLETAFHGTLWISDYVEQVGGAQIHDAYVGVMLSGEMDPEVSNALVPIDRTYGKYIDALGGGCFAGFALHLHEQRLELISEFEALLRREISEGDLFKNIFASAASGMMVGGMILTFVPPHIFGPALIVAGATAFKGGKCDINDLEKVEKWKFRKT
jgi:hypothetical protein